MRAFLTCRVTAGGITKGMTTPLWPRIAAGWRLLTGPGWDSKRVEELYGKLTNHGYGGGLVDVVARQESSPVRPQRAAPPERPDAEP